MSEGLTLDQVRITRKGETLVAVDRTVGPGDVLTIMGPSGSGKSTLLAFVTGTLSRAFEAEGRVLLNGTDVTDLPPERRRIGILLQDDLLFPHMSVAQNLAFGLRPGPDRRQRIEEALAEVDLAGYGLRDPATLSGGQRSRIALMRMLLSEPAALLLDEPFSRLDAALRDRVRDLVFTRARARQLPVLLVTHDAADADAASGDVVTLETN
ncbi:ATP-binding cassette domain-containing protein [Pelagovum pacificum]|uniref:ATP-binding cassette domain-containing protein n=1 Tax=Pelagovum pacificum TaxID=2588711 RepID=A0A5C5GGZ8_9RHOB|nr:ATP-binding cassette domain-containing protein [Pelagovum pacificum]QQA42829.1 ATP-binding cassette domain-containing protein [Pelagovum pacificum]TNY34022.1 ATP-binding cassette domain-containing protein [Pelagovum pacificum]